MSEDFHVKILEENGDSYLVADPAMTSKYVTVKELELLNEQSLNAPLMHRHRLPNGEEKVYVFGRIKDTKILDGEDGLKKQVWKAKLNKDTDSHKKMIEWITLSNKAGSKVGTSPQFEVYGNPENPTNGNLIEWSITPKPHCKECEGRIKTMEEKEVSAKLSEMQTALETMKGDRDSWKKKFEDVGASIQKEKESIMKQFEEKTLSTVKALEDKNKELESKLIAMEKEAIMVKKAPLLKELSDSKRYSPSMLKRMEDWSEKELADELDYVRKTAPAPAPIVIKTMEQSRRDAVDNDKTKEIRDAYTKKFEDFFAEVEKMVK